MQVVTVHEDSALFDAAIAHADILGGGAGVAFALTDAHTSVAAAMRAGGQTVGIGSVATVGVTRSVVDNSDLEFSLIGRMSCVVPGSTAADDSDVEADFLVRLC